MATLAEIAVTVRTLLQLCCLVVTAVILIWALRGRARSRFRGVTVWPLLGVLPAFIFHLGQLYDWLTNLLIVNGGTFRLPVPGRCRIFTADLANIEYVLKTRYHNFGKGETFKDSFGDMFGDSILVQDGEAFKRVGVSAGKAFSSPAFRPSVMRQNLLPVFSHACENAAIIDLQDVFHWLACYNICRFGAGVELDCLKPGLPRFPFLEAFEVASQSLMFLMVIPPLCWKILRFFNILSERRLVKARDIVYDFVYDCSLDHAEQDDSPAADILFAFLRYERESGRFYSEERKRESLVNLIFAGKDTVTAALTWFFWLVAKHPLVEGEILAELREIVKQRKSPEDEDPFCFSFKEVKVMEYLHAALTESLRLYAPVPIEFTVSAEDDVLPDGTSVEKGVQVLYSIYSSGRLENVWGEDCLEFKPERWMKNGRFVRQSDFKFIVFNGGPRRCTGIEFAYWQMKWVAASILIRYSIKIVDEHPVLPKYGLTLFMKHGLLATIHQREMVDGESTKLSGKPS